MTSDGRLGEYLRARRELVRPEDIGLPAAGPRRVAGLRREEVAMLAGISADYYLRLEQGRDTNPSSHVLAALARVLRLDETATTYMFDLTKPQPQAKVRPPRRAKVPAGIRQLLETIGVPAFVESRHFDVLASNSLAQAISPNLRVGTNRMRAMFLDPAEQSLCPDFELAMAHMVAGFRQSNGTDVHDPRVVQLVGELSVSSERFRQLWARHDVQIREGAQTAMYHPQLGQLMLHKERLAVGNEGLVLVIYHAVPHTDSAEKLSILSSLSAPPTTVESLASP